MDSFAKNLSFKEIKTQLEEIKATYKGMGNADGIERINTFMQQLYPSVIANNDAFKSLINTTNESFGADFATNLQNILLGVREPISDTEILANKLKEVEKQLRACGETAKAKKIKEYMQETQKKAIDVDSSINELKADIEKCFGTEAVEEFNQKLNETDNKVKSVSKGSSFGKNLRTALGIGTVALGIRKAVSFFKEATTESIDFVETQNLFNVSMGRTVDQYGNLDREASKYYTKAMAFQEKLSDKLKINIEESMEYQALFNAMSKSMGIGNEPSYKISENFTKLGYDLSSLYNINPENAMQKLRAGLSGQTKPLRDLGLDITQQSLEPLLDELGIERSVKQLSQAEKMIARYITVLRQASLAHGDFAKTMDSPANQLRIFNAQITAFKRNMGNLWQGLLGGILPYVNAIVMVINELLKMVAKLFGFKITDQNANISAGIGADDLADDLGTATGKAKELKKQLMGFDEINNISLPDNTSGGAGGGASVGGIDQRLLDAMKEYDNMMDKVKSKASDIRDKMMEWLGFHRTDDGWKLNEGLTNAEKILEVVKAIGIAIAGWTVSKSLDKVFSSLGLSNSGSVLKFGLGITFSITGTYLEHQGIRHILDGDIDAFTILETLSGMGTKFAGITSLLKNGFNLELGQALKISLPITLGLTAYNIAWAEVEKSTEEIRQKYYGNLNEISKSINKLTDERDKLLATQKGNIEQGLKEISGTQSLANELKSLVDENGRVKDGYKERVQFILTELNSALGTEYSMTDNIIDQYKEIQKELNLLILKKKAKIILDAKEEAYQNALKNQEEALKSYNKALEERQRKLEEINKVEGKNEREREENRRLKMSALATAEQEVARTLNLYKQYSEDIISYETDVARMSSDNAEEISKIINNVGQNFTKGKTVIVDSFKETINAQTMAVTLAEENYKKQAQSADETQKSILQSQVDSAKAQLQNTMDTLKAQTSLIENDETVVEAWKYMFTTHRKEFDEYIGVLPEDLKGVIKGMVGIVDSDFSLEESMRKLGLDSANAIDNSETAKQSTQNMLTSSLNQIKSPLIKTDFWNSSRALGVASANGLDASDKTSQSAINFLQGFKNKLEQQNPLNIFGIVGNLASKIVSKFNKGLGNASPSKKTKQSASYFVEGFGNQIQRLIPSSLRQIQGFATDLTNEFDNSLGIVDVGKGISINPNNFKIDTNQFIDYGQISGAIATQSNIKVDSNIEGRIENAIYSAFSNVRIPVEIEATTDEGIIFKKVQIKAREFEMQTGEPAF